MDAKDLMIEDWVLVNGSPMQIQAIDSIDDEIIAGEDLYCLIEDRIHSEDKIEPIRLTPEILEKNGWVSKRDGSGDFIYMRENTQGYGSNDMTVTKNIVGDFQMIHGSFNGISVHYVHELQHALRLCGIEKEIVL